MKKIIMTIMMMLLMIGAVFGQELTFETRVVEESQAGLVPQVVIGGDTGTGDRDVTRGEVLNDVKLLTKFTLDAYGYCDKDGSAGKYASRLDVYAQIGQSGAKYPIKTVYTTQPHNTDETVNYKITGIDTSKFPTSFDNQQITIGATHYSCYTDQIPQQPTWVKDDSWYGAYRGTNDAFNFVAKDNACDRKFLRKECDGDRVVTVYQSVTLQSDGTCLETKDYGASCDPNAERCHNGACISVLEVGTKRCASSGQIVQTWDGNDWVSELCRKDGNGYCSGAGVCNIPADQPTTQQPDVNEPVDTGSQGAQCECSIDDDQLQFAQECWDGSQVSTKICDGCYMIDTGDECPVKSVGEPTVVEPAKPNVDTGVVEPLPPKEEEPAIPTAYLLIGGAAVFLLVAVFKDQIMGKNTKKRKK